MSKPLQQLVWNETEGRVRALWRLVLHTLALVLIGFVTLVAAQSISALRQVVHTSAVQTGLYAAIVATATWLCGRTLDRRRLEDFGLQLDPRWWADFTAGFVIGALLMSGVFVVELGAGWVSFEGRFVGAPEDGSFALAFAGMVLSFTFVAFEEELLSRGYHLRNLAEGLSFERLGPRAGPRVATTLAVLISSSVFGLLHAFNPNATLLATLVNVSLAGCMLALGAVWTGQLALPIGLHLSWNLFQGNVFGFPVSGTDPGPRIWALSQGGDPLITGGAFGPEAGLIGIAAMLIGTLLQWVWVRISRRRLPAEQGAAEERAAEET